VKKVIASCLQFRCSISSNYLVPYIAARPYLNKPLLINWIVAAAFKLSGVRNEWTASVVAALGTKALPQAYLRRALDLSWFRPAGERSKSRPVLLSYRWRRSLAKSSPPRPNSPGALHWSRGNARNFCDLADSVLSGVTFSVAFASLVTRSGGRISRRRRQIRGLVTKLPPRLRLSTSLGTTSPVYSIE